MYVQIAENMERTHEDEFSWSRCFICYVLQSNSGVNSVYKQSENYHSQAYVAECRYNGVETQQQSILINSDDDEYFEM